MGNQKKNYRMISVSLDYIPKGECGGREREGRLTLFVFRRHILASGVFE